MSKAKSSARKVSTTVESTTTEAPEVTMSQVETTAEVSTVETSAEASTAHHGLSKGAKAELIAKLKSAMEKGELKFTKESENRMIAISPKGSRVILEIVEKTEDKRAKHAGKSVTCTAWVESEKTVEGQEKPQVTRSMKVNGKDLWLAVDPSYKFPTLNGAFVTTGEKRPRTNSAKKAPAVVHSIDDML
jgi:hypothetical protein